MNNDDGFSKFFEGADEEIIVEAQEETEDFVPSIDDDLIYEIDVYNSLIRDLPLLMQNNPKIQDKYLKLARHLINLKNKSKLVNLGDIEDYPDMEKVYKSEFNVSWIIPIVLDKKKIYKKLDIPDSDANEQVMNEYLDEASNKGIKYEDFIEEMMELSKYTNEVERDKIGYKTYREKLYKLDQPYMIKTEIKKKDIGYKFNLNQYSQLLRYFNVDNKFWQVYNANGPVKFSYEQYDEDDKIIATREAQIVPGDYVNIIGLLILGSEEENIIDSLNGQPWFDRIRKIGDATKILKNQEAIVVLPNHGLKTGDKVMILNSNCEPSIDGEYDSKVKVINENEFMVPVMVSKDGTTAEVFTQTTLNFKKIELDKSLLEEGNGEVVKKYEKNAKLYIFPEEELNNDEWKIMCKKLIPAANLIVENQEEKLKNLNTIEEMNDVLSQFSLEFKNLGFDNYFKLTEILEDKYIDAKKQIENFDFNKYYNEIIKLREHIIEDNKGENVSKDIIFGDKYIFNKDVIKYYGTYPNVGKDNDSIAARYNWLLKSPDYGTLYFLIVELEKVSELKNIDLSPAEIDARMKEVKKIIADSEKELKSVGDNKNCEKRKIDPVIIYDSFDKVYNDGLKITQFNIGDYAVIENNKSHENGKIFVWNGTNWEQNALIQSLEDLCLLGVEKIKEFDLEKLQCLFKTACKNKKQIRLEKRIEKMNDELKTLEKFSEYNTKEVEKKLKEQLKIAELNLQIFIREKEDTRPKEDIKIKEEDLDPLMKDIMMIPQLDTKEYLRNLLIKKDGIIIDKDIYSIRSGKKMCCGHYWYQLKIAEGGSPEYSEKVYNEMMALYAAEDVDGIYFCNHDGRPLDLLEYDTAEGLSKSTGEVDRQREVVMSEEEELKEAILETEAQEREAEIFECESSEIRTELLKIGFKVEDVAKAKDICNKINAINGKTGIILKKSEFINIIVDVVQSLQKFIDFSTFKKKEIIRLKEKGIDLSKVDTKKFEERYNDIYNIKKISLIGARLLVSYQTIIPPQYPSGKRTSIIFEGFEGNSGLEYISMLIDESKLIPITKEGGKGKEYLNMGKIKIEVEKSYYDLGDMPRIKKLKKEKKMYEGKMVKIQEMKADIVIKEIPKYEKLPDNFKKEVEKAKKYQQFYEYQKQLKGRKGFIAQQIIEDINKTISTAADKQSDDPKSVELSCCLERLDKGTGYYTYIKEKTDEHIYDLLEESRKISYYDALFLNRGVILTHEPERNRNFSVSIENLGFDREEVRKILFLTYIEDGIFKGQKHEYDENNICLLTGQNKFDILKKNYTVEEENKLIRVIIGKSLKKIIIGGSAEDEKIMKEEKDKLIDNLDLDKLKAESDGVIDAEIEDFCDKMGKLLGKNKDFVKKLEEKLKNLGYYEKIIKTEEQFVEENPNSTEADTIRFQNNKYRMRIFNLKRIINNYFRRYISVVANNFDPDPTRGKKFEKIMDVETDVSIEIQKFISEREQFIQKYLNKKNQEIFKELKFDISASAITNISGDTDKWDKEYKSVVKTVNFNLGHLSNALMYFLLKNLTGFLSHDFNKDISKNKDVANFIIELLEKIEQDFNTLDYTYGLFMPGDFRAQEHKDEEDDKPKDEASRLIARTPKLKKVRNMTDYEEALLEMEEQEKQETKKLKFIEEYSKKHGKAPTDSEVIDYLDDVEKDDDRDKEEDDEEWMDSKIEEDNELGVETGEGYGEMPQNGYDGDFD